MTTLTPVGTHKTIRVSLTREDETLRIKANSLDTGVVVYAVHMKRVDGKDQDVGRSAVKAYPDMAAAHLGVQQWADELVKEGWLRAKGNGSAKTVTFDFGKSPKPSTTPKTK